MTDCRTLYYNKQACEVQSAYCCIISIPFTWHSYMLHFMVIVPCFNREIYLCRWPVTVWYSEIISL